MVVGLKHVTVGRPVGATAVLTGIFGASTLFVVSFELLPFPFDWLEAEDWLALVEELDWV
jgi:hypothetical protein